MFTSLLRVTGVVALASILLALMVGMFITSQAKREIDNLVEATSRVARGDFSTPVMAYQEGEFSQLADSFSDMMTRLKAVQQQLVATEKIAAWQIMGRKLAHEIKNPLTPISISIDDLRRSHQEHLPDFDRLLLETTATIKSEVNRLTGLLDQFALFARMTPPVIAPVAASAFVDKVKALYRREIDRERVAVTNRSRKKHFEIDADQVQQVLVNLIKNGLEAAPGSAVSVLIIDTDDGISISVEDTGPGFPDDMLKAGVQPYVSRKAGGSGLGLVICQRIVYDHGGTMELHNREKGGAAVRVTLPFTHG